MSYEKLICEEPPLITFNPNVDVSYICIIQSHIVLLDGKYEIIQMKSSKDMRTAEYTLQNIHNTSRVLVIVMLIMDAPAESVIIEIMFDGYHLFMHDINTKNFKFLQIECLANV
jgi:hypothetical protein